MSPELALIAACCRWPDDVARSTAIAAAAEAVGDWPMIARLAEAHRVEGLVDQGLRRAAVAVPRDVAEPLAASAAEIRLRALLQIGEMLRINEAFAGSAIRHCFLKGICVGVVAYGTATLKRSWDIDLLVGPDQVLAAARLLTGFGYAPSSRRTFDEGEFARWSVVSKELEFTSPRGTAVELHWRLSDHPALLGGVGMESPLRPVPLIGDHQVETLADAPCLAYLAVHGAAHGWSRLKWLADFNALLAARGASEREELIAAARGHGTGRALDQALSLAERWLGAVIPRQPAAIGRDLSAHRQLVRLAERVIEARAAGEPIEDNVSARLATVRAQWLMAPGVANVGREVLRLLRGSEDRRRWPLPAWLYWLIRPFTALSRAAMRAQWLRGSR